MALKPTQVNVHYLHLSIDHNLAVIGATRHPSIINELQLVSTDTPKKEVDS